MALVQKQESNFTGLRYAVEQSPGVLPGNPTWYPVEPNDYKDFGGETKTKARRPINPSRQRKKGVVVDLDAMAGFTQDMTATNSQDIMQTHMAANLRKKANVAVANVDGTGNDYEPASGGTAFEANDLIFAENFALTANNGLKVVTGTPLAASVPVTDTGLLSETGATSGLISLAGYQYASGLLSVTAGGGYPTITAANVAAAQTLTNDGVNVSNADTVTIDGKVYTFQTSLTNVDGNVKIGASNTASMTNLFNAINGSGGVPGTDYALATIAHTTVTATNPSGVTVTVTAKTAGAKANGIAVSEASTHLSWGAATLAGGVGRAFTTFGWVPGEIIFIGDSSNSAYSFANALDNGFCRIRSITQSVITLDKTQFIMATDAGTAKTIRLFFGDVLKNEVDPLLIVKKTVQFERDLGAPDDALPSAKQAEYITRSLGDNMKLDAKTGDIVKLEFAHIGGTQELRTSAQGLKTGTRPNIVESDAFNTTSDISLFKMAAVTAGNSCPTPLFAFLTDLTMEIKNNVSRNKALGVLGAFDTTLGLFEVMATLTAYFQNVDSLQLVQSNASVTLECHFAKANKGVSIDLPLVTLSKAVADVKIDEAVMLPLQSDAASAAFIDPNLDYTLLWVYWKYLPDSAM